MDVRTIQTTLASKGFSPGPIDGRWGPQTEAAATEWLRSSGVDMQGWGPNQIRMAAQQLGLQVLGFDPGPIDGKDGPRTRAAKAAYVAKDREGELPLPPTPKQPAPGANRPVWPRQKDVPAVFGKVGENQVMVPVPYPIFYDGKLVKKISLHTKVAASAERVFANVLKVYGLEQIKKLRLDVWDGSLNVRKMRGGTQWSMHSWGIAIDWDAGRNGLNTHAPQAAFSAPQYEQWFECWEAEGWVSLGRERDYDWMHVQAARL